MAVPSRVYANWCQTTRQQTSSTRARARPPHKTWTMNTFCLCCMHAVCATMRRRPSCKHLPLKVNSNVYKSITLIAICRWPRMAFSMQPSPKTVHCLRHFASRRSITRRFLPSVVIPCCGDRLDVRVTTVIHPFASIRSVRRRVASKYASTELRLYWCRLRTYVYTYTGAGIYDNNMPAQGNDDRLYETVYSAAETYKLTQLDLGLIFVFFSDKFSSVTKL